MVVPAPRRRGLMRVHMASVGTLAGIFFAGQRASRGADLQTVTQRVTAQLLSSVPSESTVQGYMSSLQSNGSWPDVNYADTSATNWSPQTALTQMQDMAEAYASPSSPLYQNAKLSADISSAFNYYISVNPQSTNWWYNDIGSLQSLGDTMILFSSQLSSGQLSQGNTFLSRAAAAIPEYGSGQNMVDLAIVGIDQGIVSNSSSTVATAFSEIGGTIAVLPADGIQYDGSFQFHGPQLYIGGYGQLYDNDVLNEAAISAGTSYAITTAQQDLIINQLINGTQWFIRGQALDVTASGRGDSRAGISTSGTSYENAIENALALGTYDTAQLQAFLDRQQAAVASGVASSTQYTLSGNRDFYDSDIMVQQRPAYYESVKISSVRTSQPETGNGEGLTNLYLGDGVNQIMVTGKEYANIEPVWNWYMLPGTTVEQDGRSLTPSVAWGETGTATYAGGVSDGACGAEGFNYNRFDVAAKKSWYFFDNEEVALGAAITSSNTSCPVYTTLNQCLLTSTITYQTTGSASPQNLSSGTVTPAGLKWVYQGGVGYFFLNPVSNATIEAATQTGSWYEINTTQSDTPVSANVFTLYLNHGTAVSNGSYSYIVVPGITESQMASYEASIPIQVLADNSAVQAVRQSSLNISQGTFYSAGSFSITGGQTISANVPSMLMLEQKPNQLQFWASNPQNAQLNLTATLSGLSLSMANSPAWFDAFGSATVNYNLPGGNLAGSSVGFTLNMIGSTTPTVTLSSNDGTTNYSLAVNAPVALPGNTTFAVDPLTTLTFSAPISGSASVTQTGTSTGSGTVNLAAVNTYSGATIVNGGVMLVTANQSGGGGWSVDPDNSAASTLNVSAAVNNTGSLYVGEHGSLILSSNGNWTQGGAVSGYAPVPVTFAGTATLNFNQPAGTSQSMGNLNFNAGDGTIQSTYGGSGTTKLTFNGINRSTGATANFVASGGGSSNTIFITGQAGELINQGTFFNGSSYAWMNSSGGYVRGIIYGADSGTATSGAATSLTSSAANQQITGATRAQATKTFTTLNDSGNYNFTLASGATVTVNGILKTGNVSGGAVISGGTALQASGGADLVIRTAGPNDLLTIDSAIVNNSNSALTKSGPGTLKLAGTNTFTGGIFVNAGVLQINAAADLGNIASTLSVSSATVEVTANNFTTGRVISLGSFSSTFQIDSGAVLSPTGVITGSGTLNKTGSGWMNLSGTSTYTGGTNLAAGVLSVGASSTSFTGPLGAGNLYLSGGTLTNTTLVTLGNPIVAVPGTTSNVIASASGNLILTGSITGPGVFQNNANASNSVVIQGDISGFTGTFNYVDTSGLNNLTFNGSGNAINASSAHFVLSGATAGASRGLSLNSSGVFQMGDLSGTGGLITTNQADAPMLQVGALNDNPGAFAGSISNGDGQLSLTKVGSGTLSLAGTSSFTGPTNVSAGTLTIVSGGALAGTASITVAAGATFNDAGGITSVPVVSVSGVATFGPAAATGISPLNLASLSLGSAAKPGQVSLISPLSHGNRSVLVTLSLTFPGTTSSWQGTLDLGSNDAVIRNGSIGQITNQIAEGLTGTAGIFSSAANADASHLTALGAILISASQTFDGLTAVSGDVLIKYTYFGDTNLDGQVDGTDYERIDDGYLNQLTGWYNGDFNYDGAVNGSDYTLMDNAFNNQGASLASIIASPDAATTAQIAGGGQSSSVPEPASAAMLGAIGIGCIGRRRRR